MRTTLFISGSVVALLMVMAIYPVAPAQAQSTTAVTGYAWSETIGWISFDCHTGGPTGNDICATKNYGVSIASDGTLSGYAWSDAIGWIKFGGLSGFPGSGTNAHMSGTALTGWARACAGTAAGDCSSMTSRTDGWDGWISLSGSSPAYGPSLSSGIFSGYAWGSDVVGWISFSAGTYGVMTGYQACMSTQEYQCVNGNSVHTAADCSVTTDVCASYGSGWFCASDTYACTRPPSPTSNLAEEILRIRPRLVHAGQTVTVSWDVSNANSCSVSEDNPSIVDAWSGVPSGTHTSSPINRTTTYVLSCVGDGGTLTGTSSASVVPVWREI